MMTITVAFGTSTPTSITVVATRTSISPAENARITRSFSSGCSLPCRMPSRSPASGPASRVAATSSTDSGWRRPTLVMLRGTPWLRSTVVGSMAAKVVLVGVVAVVGFGAVADARADHVGLPAAARLPP